MLRWTTVGCVLAGFILALTATQQEANAVTRKPDKPNIILINMDNFGYGELGCYGGGITRGAPTPRIDRLAREGLRLTNFNVEAQCTPSRAALMTGRYAKRTGNASVPMFSDYYGLTQWEYTMAEMLSDAGYVTAMYGKWHLGNYEGRYPNDQGFDEWYGAPNSTDESAWPSQPRFMALVNEKVHPMMTSTQLLEGRKGEKSKEIAEWTLEQRREMDMVLTEKTMDFMQRQVKKDKPFFVYLPYTLTHYPVMPSKEFQDKSGNGLWGDVLMQIDYNIGRLLDTIDKLGIKDDTIFIFTADNGAEMNPGYQGWAGPWSGTYFTAREGSLRVPFIMRWPGKVPADAASNEIVHQMDLFTTFARIAGGKVPTDRIIDGVDQTDFFLGQQKRSNRDGFVIYVGEDIFGAKWRNYKMLTKHVIGGPGYESREWGYGNVVNGLAFYDLYADPREAYPWTKDTPVQFWRRFPLTKLVADHAKSLAAEPPIKPGTQDPYVPPK